MANVFDGLNKLDDETLKYEIASLEIITTKNVLKEYGQKAKKGTINLANKVRGLFSNNRFTIPEVTTIQDQITNKKNELNNENRENLNNIMRNTLISKVNSVDSKACLTEHSSDDEISASIILVATKNYNDINDNLSIAQKADAITKRYKEELLSQVNKTLRNQTDEEKHKTEKSIQKELDKMDEKTQNELKKSLKLQELNGQTIRSLLTTATGTATALLVLDAAGFSAYTALTTIIHAIFTTVLGITLPFAASILAIITGPFGWIALAGIEALLLKKNNNNLVYKLLSQIVWLSVETYGKKFTPSEDDLPSWLPDSDRNNANKASKELMKLIDENSNLKEKQSLLEKSI